jgi:ribonucleoside-diphosphate reductase beta chain
MRAKNGRNGRNQQVLGASTGPQMDLLPLPGLMTPSAAYKPFRYPWAVELWRRQQQIHWLPEEVPLGEDCKDWATRLTDPERNLLTQVFRFFTQSDVEVQDNYLERYARVFRPTEVKMMLAAFANMETVHIVAYALLLETIGMPDTEFAAFMDYRAMRDKHDYMQRFGVASEADILRTLAMFGGFTEGLQLFASFAILLNFPRHNKMRGMGQIVSWSVRDESLHCEGIIRLFHTFAAETGALTRSVREDIVDCARTVVALEDKFIDLAFEMGPIEGLDAEEVKRYIRYVADCVSSACRKSTRWASIRCRGSPRS